MKKYLLTILLGAFGVMAIAVPAFAITSVSFTPVSVNVRQGQSFTITIGVNPQGVKNYTAKTELHYSADLLEVKSFTFAPSWMPLAQTGYDLTDNTNGVLIKTAGYPGGVSSAVTFGTVSFFAKKSGNGTIVLNKGNSLALDASNQNIISSAAVQTTAIISTPTSVTPPTSSVEELIEKKDIISDEQVSETIPVLPTSSAQEQESELADESIVSEGQKLAAQEPADTSLLAPQSLWASIGNVISLGTNSVIIGLLIVMAFFAFVGYTMYVVIRRAYRRVSK